MGYLVPHEDLVELGLFHPVDQTLELQLLSTLWSCGPLLDSVLVCVF